MASTKKKKFKDQNFFDYTLLFVVIFLIVFGLVMIYSTSSYEAASDFNDSTLYLRRQLFATILGVFVMAATTLIDYHLWERFSLIGAVVAFVLVLLVLTPLGIEVNGARRWVGIGPLSMQPAEVVKIEVILFCAVLITKMNKKRISSIKGMFTILMLPAIFAVMLWQITNNLSSAIIVGGIAVVMLFVADSDYLKYILALLAVIAVAALVVYVATHWESGSFRLKRVKVWLDPESDPSDTGFQTLQALYAIGSGGIFGKGLGNSMQKLGFLPEAQNDMIFSIICEELGLFGALAVILLFLLLIWRCMVIANNSPDLFGAMLVVGVMAHFAIQVILNIAVVTNTMPNTGISLPFISYGGTSEMFLMAEIGLVLNVSRQIRLRDAM
ncbi:MAG: putative lipid II flippase FtsW [Lachnospiraceae bacterium]|nr:putative lipid II flippase FtsW [Lachnospiraceae bacterium]